MRVGYTEDEDYPGQFALFQANCRRSIQGRKGQVSLRALESALLTLPVKRIARDVLVEPDGEVCAIGSLMVQRRINAGMSREEAVAVCAKADPLDTQYEGEQAGLPRAVSWSVAVENDKYPWDGIKMRTVLDETPEQRHERILAWVQTQLTG